MALELLHLHFDNVCNSYFGHLLLLELVKSVHRRSVILLALNPRELSTYSFFSFYSQQYSSWLSIPHVIKLGSFTENFSPQLDRICHFWHDSQNLFFCLMCGIYYLFSLILSSSTPIVTQTKKCLMQSKQEMSGITPFHKSKDSESMYRYVRFLVHLPRVKTITFPWSLSDLLILSVSICWTPNSNLSAMLSDNLRKSQDAQLDVDWFRVIGLMGLMDNCELGQLPPKW